MNDIEINDILTSFRNHEISEADFSLIQKQNPSVEWDRLLKEDLFIQTMFDAKLYESLKDTIDKDIDAIERKTKIKKTALYSLAIVGVLGFGIYLLTEKETLPKQNKENKTTDIELSKPDKKEVENIISTPKTEHKLAPIASATTSEKTELKNLYNTSITSSKIEEKKDNVVSKTKQVEEAKEVIAEQKMEKKQTPIAPVVPPKEMVDLPKEVPTKKELVNPVAESKPSTKNYIINPSKYDYLDINTVDAPAKLIVQNLEGRIVFENNYLEGDLINWEAIDLNNNALKNGLYIYQVIKENKTIQFGQITIVE